MRLATYWLRRFTRNKVAFRVQYHADQDLDALQWFWATHLGVSSEEIQFQRKSNSGQLNGRTWRSVHGVLTVATYDTYSARVCRRGSIASRRDG